ncbi:MAG TPA: hypothetical protein VIL88_04950 [Devosia sp.]|jgi:preprotein translocase subunit SecD|uniref:SecDF P1 head subdomain-containing protein n=1 Tax=Devosia sp. TaxID=1871048 RepID=UPI002F9404E4
MNRRVLMALSLALLTVAPGLVLAQEVTIEIQSADAKRDEATGEPMLVLLMSGDGQEAFADFTAAHVGEVVDVLVDGHLVTSPVIRSPISDRWMVLNGSFALEAAEALAERLNRSAADVVVRVHRKQKNP